MNHFTTRSILFISLFFGEFAFSAEPTVSKEQMPRFAAVEAKDAARTLRLRPGFRAQLAASEPNVASPVALAFDENSRLYVVEMIDYSERRDEKLGRIRLLDDRDGDGRYETSTVFADGMGWPTAVFCWDGGIFVGCSPDILYFKDTDGDGKADVKRTVFTGFAQGVQKLNVQALLNSFNWGMDNRIHGATSMNGGMVKRVQGSGVGVQGEQGVNLRGRGFVFDPRSFSLVAENGGGQHGLSFDSWGRLFVCSNSRHIQTFAYDGRYADRNKDFPMPAPLLDIAVDGPAAEVYRASPEEPWRVIRTKWRVSGLSPGPIEGGGRSAGYFTGATGATIYRGDAYGPDFVDNAFIGDAGGNLVHRKRIVPDGVIVRAQRADDEQKSEFLASTDTWFRPVQFANAPDGCLWVIDMYRETIEHPWSLPPNLKQHLDLNSGNDRGRLWRIVPDGHTPRTEVRLGDLTTAQLVDTLNHPNGWHRETAARLLYQRQDKAAIAVLEQRLKRAGAENAQGRLWSVYALDGLGALKGEHVLAALGDPEPHIRIHGIRLAERFLDDPRIVAVLDQSCNDPADTVRFQLALTLGYVNDDRLAARLARIIVQDPADPWISAAALNAIGARAHELFAVLCEDRYAAAAPLLPKLAYMIGARAQPDQIGAVIERAGKMPAAAMLAVGRGLGDGMRKAGRPFDVEKGAAIHEMARKLAADPAAPEQQRIDAVGLLGTTSWRGESSLLLGLIAPAQPQSIQSAAIAALDALDQGDLATALLQRWPALSPRVRETAATALVKRPARARLLLDALEAGKLRKSDLSGSQVSALRQSSDKSIKARAAAIFDTTATKRDELIRKFSAAVDLPGDAKKGRELYLARCASCHRLAGEGNALGPDLESVRTTGREKLLTSVLDPNREVAPAFAGYVIETADDETHIGLIDSETASAVTLKMAYAATVTVPRDQIKSMRTTGLSMMPEGLEDGLAIQDIANLLSFIEGK